MQALLFIAEKYASLPIPGYTHLQRAQPVTVGHHMLAHIESLGRDHERFSVVAKHANACPLGSGCNCRQHSSIGSRIHCQDSWVCRW